MKPFKVLVIEDDPTLNRVLKDNLTHEGYEVQTALDGLLGIELITSFTPDIVLLDIMLPNLNGFSICERVRKVDQNTPILMLTAKSEEQDIIRGLKLGANDYITKPFRLAELLARVKANLRSAFVSTSVVQDIGSLSWNSNLEVLLNEQKKEIPLTPKERNLFAYLMKNPNRVFTRDQLLNAVWGHTFIASGRNIDRCVTGLRKKLELEAGISNVLKTVRGIGYYLELK